MLEKVKDIEKINENFVAEKTFSGVHTVVSAALLVIYATGFNESKTLKKIPLEKIFSVVTLVFFVIISGIIAFTMKKEVKKDDEVYTYDKKIGLDVMTASGLHLLASALLVVFVFRKHPKLKSLNKMIPKSFSGFADKVISEYMGYFWLVSLLLCAFMYMRYNDESIKEKYHAEDKKDKKHKKGKKEKKNMK